MELDVDTIFQQMTDAAEGAFKEGWAAIKTYAPAEFKKMAVQLVEITQNVALFEIDPTQGYSPETGQILFKMQRTACESVLVAVSSLTLIAVQHALDALLKILGEAFSGIIALVL